MGLIPTPNSMIQSAISKALNALGIPEGVLDLLAKPARELTMEAAKEVAQQGQYKEMLMQFYNAVLQKRGELEYIQKLNETPEETKERLRVEFNTKKQRELIASNPELLRQREANILKELESEYNSKMSTQHTAQTEIPMPVAVIPTNIIDGGINNGTRETL